MEPGVKICSSRAADKGRKGRPVDADLTKAPKLVNSAVNFGRPRFSFQFPPVQTSCFRFDRGKVQWPSPPPPPPPPGARLRLKASTVGHMILKSSLVQTRGAPGPPPSSGASGSVLLVAVPAHTVGGERNATVSTEARLEVRDVTGAASPGLETLLKMRFQPFTSPTSAGLSAGFLLKQTVVVEAILTLESRRAPRNRTGTRLHGPLARTAADKQKELCISSFLVRTQTKEPKKPPKLPLPAVAGISADPAGGSRTRWPNSFTH